MIRVSVNYGGVWVGVGPDLLPNSVPANLLRTNFLFFKIFKNIFECCEKRKLADA